MYLEKLPGLRARIAAYQEKTLCTELFWSLPRPVPTPKRSERGDYWFSSGYFQQPDTNESRQANLAVFMTNPNDRVHLCNPHGFMLVCTPGVSLADQIVLFHSHIREKGFVTIPLGEGEHINVIKGVVPELPWNSEEAELFNFQLNKEIAKLFFLASASAHSRVIKQAEVEFVILELSGFPE